MKGKDRQEWCEMTGYDGSEAQHQAIRNLASLPIDFTLLGMVIDSNLLQSLKANSEIEFKLLGRTIFCKDAQPSKQ